MENNSDKQKSLILTSTHDGITFNGVFKKSDTQLSIAGDDPSSILVVTFPGRDKTPVFVEKAEDHFFEIGMDTLRLGYGNLPWNQDSREVALDLILEILKQAGVASYEKLIFLAYSIGTVFSSDITANKYENALNILLSPIDGALNSMSKINFKAIAGSEDVLLTNELAKLHLKEKFMEIEFIDKANHELEYKSLEQTAELHEEIVRNIIILTNELLHE